MRDLTPSVDAANEEPNLSPILQVLKMLGTRVFNKLNDWIATRKIRPEMSENFSQ